MSKYLNILFFSLGLFFVKQESRFGHSFDSSTDTTILVNIITPVDSLWMDVIVDGGQSNAEGGDQGGTTPVQFRDAFSNALIFQKTTNTSTANGFVAPLDDGVNNNWRTPTLRFGPESGTAYYLQQAGKDTVGFVKYGYAGSRLVDVGPFSFGNWDVNATNAPLHYSKLVDFFVKPALDSFTARGYHPHIKAFIWCQGEADAQDSTCAANYETKLVQLLDQFKTDLRSKDPAVDSMHVIIVKVRNNSTYSPQIRQAETNIANTYLNAHLLDSDSWPRISDSIHYTRTAQATMFGLGVTNILIPLLK